MFALYWVYRVSCLQCFISLSHISESLVGYLYVACYRLIKSAKWVAFSLDGNCYTSDRNNTEKQTNILCQWSHATFLPFTAHSWVLLNILVEKRPTITESLFKPHFTVLIVNSHHWKSRDSQVFESPLCVRTEQHSGHLVYFYNKRITSLALLP